MGQTVKSRAEVPVQETWDLSLIYADEAAFQHDVSEMQALTADIATRFQGHLSQPEAICECLRIYQQVLQLMYLTSAYSSLQVEADRYDRAALECSARIGNICTDIGSRLSFIESELSEQPE